MEHLGYFYIPFSKWRDSNTPPPSCELSVLTTRPWLLNYFDSNLFNQVVMRDMNQYLYREVNAKRENTYIDIDRLHHDSSSSVSTSNTTMSTNYRFDERSDSFLQVRKNVGKTPE